MLFFSSTYFSHAMSYHLHCSILKADSERVSYQQCLGINYSSIIWKRNNSLKDPFSLSDGDYPMVWKWLSCKCFGTNHSKVSRHLWSKVSWKQWLLIPTSLGSTVFLNEKQRARAENMTFQWGSRRWQKFSGSYEVLQHRVGLQCQILGLEVILKWWWASCQCWEAARPHCSLVSLSDADGNCDDSVFLGACSGIALPK